MGGAPLSFHQRAFSPELSNHLHHTKFLHHAIATSPSFPASIRFRSFHFSRVLHVGESDGRRTRQGGESDGRRTRHVLSARWRWGDDEDSESEDSDVSFEHGVGLFNRGEYYKCHDVLENLWNSSQEPKRSVLHGILQCSVGLYHLLNQNHRGAMTELGEGLAKLRRQRFTAGPFHQFEQEVSALLEYIYNTQLEHAACTEDLCLTMDGSKQSYQLLGDFAAGQHLYEIRRAENDQLYIFFITPTVANLEYKDYATASLKVKVPLLNTTADDLYRLE